VPFDDSKPPNESVESLYARFSGELKRYIQRSASITQSTEDLVHEVYVRLLIYPDRSEIRDPRAFLYWIANCVMATETRKVRKARRLTVSFNAEESEEHVTLYPRLWMADDSSEDADQADLKRAIDALPEHLRQVFVLQRCGGHTIAAIAQLTGINPNTVRSYLMQAKTQLREFYRVDAQSEE
jgi:RNA polymerase sigma factor (sigma-70 family)